MTVWRLHWLEAQDSLSAWRGRIQDEIDLAERAMARALPLPPMDVLIQRLAGAVIPETGTMGQAIRPRLFTLTIDPDNPNFARSLGNGDLRRTAVHEAHHCLRMAGPGYGRTLGESLVSEGLAGQFVRQLFDTPPDLWECAMDDDALSAHAPSAADLAAADYDHGNWFFGTGARPRWLGYTLGYRVVGDWLAGRPRLDGLRWAEAPAEEVLAASRLGSAPR